MKTIITLLAVLMLASVVAQPGQAATGSGGQIIQPHFPEKVKEQVKYLSGMPMLLRAQALGVRSIAGRDISATSQPAKNKPRPGKDVAIGADPLIEENEPSVAANPVKSNRLVAASHYITFTRVDCVAYSSSNGGVNWKQPVFMRQLTAFSSCSDPVLAYAPDGSRVYYAYMDIKSFFEETDTTITFTDDWDIVVSFSDDNGAHWTGPIVALEGDPTITTFELSTGEVIDYKPGFFYDKPWIATSPDPEQKDWVYVTATRFDNFEPFDCHVAFARSRNKSAAWSNPMLLDGSSGGCGNPVVVQGSRPGAGEGGNVLVAWYNSGLDGWLEGGFEIRTRHSANHGRKWDDIVVAASDSYEAPFYLGPQGFYNRWWGVMFPDVEIDGEEAAHIAYTHDPVQNPLGFISDTAEDGDIRYITSPRKPYRRWSAPVTVNDDGMVRAQGWAALETQTKDEETTVYILWEDHRLSPDLPVDFPNSPNLYYDIFAAKKVSGRSKWLPNQRLSDASSIMDFAFIGDYFDLTVNDKFFFGVWTDRRDKFDIFDFEDDVFGSGKLK